MWIHSKSRNEQDNRLLLNLDLCSRINLTQLGEKWFIEVMLGSEAHPIAAVESREEATEIVKRISDALRNGKGVVDLDAPADEENR